MDRDKDGIEDRKERITMIIVSICVIVFGLGTMLFELPITNSISFKLAILGYGGLMGKSLFEKILNKFI